MSGKKCTCGAVTHVGIWDGVTSSEGCPAHSKVAIKRLLNEYLQELPLPKKVLDKLQALKEKANE